MIVKATRELLSRELLGDRIINPATRGLRPRFARNKQVPAYSFYYFADLKELACLGALEVMMHKKRGIKNPSSIVEIKKVSNQEFSYCNTL